MNQFYSIERFNPLTELFAAHDSLTADTSVHLPKNAQDPILVDAAHTLFKELMDKKMSAEEVSAAGVLSTIQQRAHNQRDITRGTSRTAALWLQYMEMIDILRTFIKAERTANWELHLQTVSEMLPYLAASGHSLYVKCAHLYLQSMINLQNEHPDVYRDFIAGFHVVRRSDRQWAGLSTDLVIEQVLMRSLKTTGGLTRGRGMTEQQRLIWLLAMPACAEANRSMQELTGVQFNSGEQNKDVTQARQKRDMKDTLAILTTLADRSPFAPNSQLVNIMTGVSAGSAVDVDRARATGKNILASMIGKSVADYTFKRNAQAVTLASKSSVRIESDNVQIDPQLLFQRLIIACNSSDDLGKLFCYELCSYPTALFDSPLTLRQPQKPALADALWAKLSPGATSGPAGEVQYVLDGGALLHRIPWPRGSITYQDICGLYSSYVVKKYVKPIVVFDGYDRVSTKNMTQQRRAVGKAGPTVTFTEDMKVTLKKDDFLSNSKNKQRFINMLSQFLKKSNCTTYHADGDADVLIVKTAVESARERTTVLVGDDTDLLVLLCFYTHPDGYDLFFKPEPKANSRRRVWNMKKVKEQLGFNVCRDILFLHAISGCDTTSRPYGIGKAGALKKYVNSQHFREQAKVFDLPSSLDDVVAAGEEALVSLYGGKPGEKLDTLRHQRYCEKLATKSSQIQPQNLPPTSAAAKYHSQRVYLQVKQWKGEDEEISVEDWGWKLSDDQVHPVMTDLPAAPESLLRMIRCNCSLDCASKRCSCRKHGLECSPACGQCRGTACTNSTNQDFDDSDDDGD